MSDSAIADREPLPPDETFWKRYSPRHECPIAGSASTLVHLVALGGVILAGLAMSWRWYGEKAQPPAMSVVYVEGNGATVGNPAAAAVRRKTAAPKTSRSDRNRSSPRSRRRNRRIRSFWCRGSCPAKIRTSLCRCLRRRPTSTRRSRRCRKKTPRPAAANAKSSGSKSTGLGSTGDGGGLGTGKGTGVGPGNGPGDGTGPAGATTKSIRAQILANRWHFDSGGSPRERIAKFAAVGITLGFTDFTGNLYVIEDMKRRPVKFHLDSFDRYKDIVKWANNKDDPALPGLARELGLPLTLAQLVLLLPPDREQKMADEEMRYAREKGYDFSKVEGTLFDFVLMQGVYEPVVKGQAPFDKSVPIGKTRGR